MSVFLTFDPLSLSFCCSRNPSWKFFPSHGWLFLHLTVTFLTGFFITQFSLSSENRCGHAHTNQMETLFFPKLKKDFVSWIFPQFSWLEHTQSVRVCLSFYSDTLFHCSNGKFFPPKLWKTLSESFSWLKHSQSVLFLLHSNTLFHCWDGNSFFSLSKLKKKTINLSSIFMTETQSGCALLSPATHSPTIEKSCLIFPSPHVWWWWSVIIQWIVSCALINFLVHLVV